MQSKPNQLNTLPLSNRDPFIHLAGQPVKREAPVKHRVPVIGMFDR